MTQGEWQALKRLRECSTIIIKSADKGNAVIIIKRELLVRQGYITEKQAEYVGGRETPRARSFYILPKIHKEKASWPFPDMPLG